MEGSSSMPQRIKGSPARRLGALLVAALFSFCLLYTEYLPLSSAPAERSQPGPVRLLSAARRVRVYCMAAGESLRESPSCERMPAHRFFPALPSCPPAYPPALPLRHESCAAPTHPSVLEGRLGLRHAGRAPPLPPSV